MTKSFSNSPHKKTHPLFIVFFGFVCFIIFLDIACSFALNKAIVRIKDFVRESDGYSLNVGFAYFDIFKGLTVAGLKLTKDGEALFSSQSLDLGFDVLSLLKKRVFIKNVFLGHPRFFPEKAADISFLLKRLSAKNDILAGFYETTYIKVSGATAGDAALLDAQGYLSAVKGGLFISRGTILFKRLLPSVFGDVDFFKGSSFYKSFDYVFEVEARPDELLVSRIELSNAGLKFTGNGRIETGVGAYKISLIMNLINITLDDFPFLNREHLQSRGVIDASLNVSGTVGDLKALVDLKVTNARITFFDSFVLDKVNGTAVVAEDHFVGRDFSLIANGMPFRADFAIYKKETPQVILRFRSMEKADALSAFVLSLSGQWIDGELEGDMNSRLKYISRDTTNTLDFDLKSFRLGCEDDLFLTAGTFEARLAVERINQIKESVKIFDKTLTLGHLFSIIRRQKDGFALDNLRSSCYEGTLEGRVDFIPVRNHLGIRGEAHLRDVDLNQFFEYAVEGQRVLSGTLAGDLRFDIDAVDMFKGQVFISDGLLQEHPLLNAVANFLGVTSLKKLKFDDLSMFFVGGRGDYSSQVKLQAMQVQGFLDEKITSYDTMDGYLTISLTTKLLSESKQFKKILSYIKHDEPFVVFPFKISSYVNSPRVLWLKNEFKEKLQNLLPERNKRFLQRQVNSMVEKIEEE